MFIYAFFAKPKSNCHSFKRLTGRGGETDPRITALETYLRAKYLVKQICIVIVNSFMIDISLIRSNHQRCSIKKVVLKNFAKFSGKHLCQSLFE